MPAATEIINVRNTSIDAPPSLCLYGGGNAFIVQDSTEKVKPGQENPLTKAAELYRR